MEKPNAVRRIKAIKDHLSRARIRCHGDKYPEPNHCPVDSVKVSSTPGASVQVEGPLRGCELYHSTLLTSEALAFIAEMVHRFDGDVDAMLRRRAKRKLELDESGKLPDFPVDARGVRSGTWCVGPVPRRLRCRHVDLGDVSPANTDHFVSALNSTAQGIQTDFDDGHCPVWANHLRGLYNVYVAVHNKIPGVPTINKAPVLMLRPRAWNMVENNMLVNGKVVPGPLFDFGLLMYHNARKLIEAKSGPFFYLSKLEGYLEARLWNDIFVWTQNKLNIPVGTIKACVLIENILASFEMEEILYELRNHSAGLNCGIWDYSASFVNKFGHRSEFVIPDRSKYVSMDRHFLKSYMDLVIETCHRRGTLATGGMAALVLPTQDQRSDQSTRTTVQKVTSAKLVEIKAGADGFMVYDLSLVRPTQELFSKHAPTENQIHVKRQDVKVTASDLLLMPTGGVTTEGLKHNISVGILFIYAWLAGQGHYYLKGAVEDSATAEISRSQVWQWLRHQSRLEDGTREVITRKLVQSIIETFIHETLTGPDSKFSLDSERQNLCIAAQIFQEIVTKRQFPEFITTYLYEEHAIRKAHCM